QHRPCVLLTKGQDLAVGRCSFPYLLHRFLVGGLVDTLLAEKTTDAVQHAPLSGVDVALLDVESRLLETRGWEPKHHRLLIIRDLDPVLVESFEADHRVNSADTNEQQPLTSDPGRDPL